MRDRRIAVFSAFSLLALATAPALALDAATVPVRPSLQLAITINGTDTGEVVPVTEERDGGLSISRADLEELGVFVSGDGPGTEVVPLDSIGVGYRYDAPGQILDLHLAPEQRRLKVYDARGDVAPAVQATSSWGALLNYSLFASTSTSVQNWQVAQPTANLATEARLFGPYGLYSQSSIVGTGRQFDMPWGQSASVLRLESTYTFADQGTQTAYRVGDTISGGLDWTRPIRLGGLQVQRNFGLRPDLVTAALPSLSGTAAVPTSVDVLVNGVRTFSQPVAEGPYRIANLPVSSANGDVEVVLRDATGAETRRPVSLFTDTGLIAGGLFDFSAEGGFTRQFYGLRSADYDRHFVASGSTRYGWTDALNLDAHAEVGAGLINASGGGAGALGPYGTLVGATALSHSPDGMGAQLYAAYNLRAWRGITFGASLQRTFGAFDDLASVTATNWNRTGTGSQLAAGIVYIHPPREIDRISLGSAVPGLGGSASLSLARVVADPRDLAAGLGATSSKTVTASYSRPLLGGEFVVTAYGDVAGTRGRGIFAGFVMPLGDRIQASAGLQSVQDPSNGRSSIGINLQASRDAGTEPGGFGWALGATKAATTLAVASATYNTTYGTARIGGFQQGSLVSGNAQFEGAVAFAGGALAAGPRTGDAFAVVRTGEPGVSVLRDNVAAGTTGAFGTLLVPNLRPYEANKLAIDPSTLPLEVVPSSTEQVVAPASRSGIGVNFAMDSGTRSLVVVLRDRDGRPLPPGSRGTVLESGRRFLVGFDGRAFLTEAGTQNTIEIDLGARDCRAAFAAPANPGLDREVALTCE